MQKNPALIVRISPSVTEINRKEWDSIFPHIAESYAFFKTIDETLLCQFKPYYISIYDDSGIVCIAPCFIMDYPLETTLEGPFKKIILKLNKLFPKLFTLRMLFCGSPACEGRVGIKGSKRVDIIESLLNSMYSIAQKENACLIAFKDFSEEYLNFFEPLFSMGFYRMQSYPAVELDIQFKTFEDYLSSLSRVTRKGLKKKFRQLPGDIHIEMQVTSELGPLLEEAYALYLNTLNKSGVQFERLPKAFFKNISQNMPQETKYFVWSIDGKLVAFDLCLVSNGVLVDEYIGLDYAVAYKYHLYYLTFRDILNWCIENNVTKYESGALSYAPKKRLNLKFIPEYIYVKHKNVLINFFIGLLCLLLKPENFDPTLKSLKENSKK